MSRVSPGRLLLSCVLVLLVAVPFYSAATYVVSLFAERNTLDVQVLHFDYLETGRIPNHPANSDIGTPRPYCLRKIPVFHKTPEKRYVAQVREDPNETNNVIGYHFTRHLTEDISLPCELFVEVPPDIDDSELFVDARWVTNYGPVRVDDKRISLKQHRGFLSWVPTENETRGIRWFFVMDTLGIRRLVGSDFTEYVCKIDVSFYDPSRNESVLEELNMEPSTDVSVFPISKPSPMTDVYKVHPLDMVKVDIIYKTLPDSDDHVTIEHRVNGKPTDKLPEIDCSLPINFLGPDRTLSNEQLVTSNPGGHRVLIDTHPMCLEHYNYGLHTFTIRREFYNPHTKQRDFVETEYYLSLLIVPELSELFSDAKNNAYFPFTHKADCWEETGRPKDTEFCNSQLRLLKTIGRIQYILDTWAIKIICLLVYLFWLWGTYGYVKYVLRLTIPELFRDVVTTAAPLDTGSHPLLVENTHTSSGELNNTSRKSAVAASTAIHESFLAYALEDSVACERVKQVLVDQDVRVYDSHHDVRPGQATLSAWDDAMEHSQAFVVLVSRHYLAQPELRKQFQDIYNLLLERHVTPDRLLLLVTGNCRVPPALGPLPIVNLDLLRWERHLEWWALTFKGQFSNRSVLMQMGRDIHRDSQDFLELNRRDDDVQQLLPGISSLFNKLEAILQSVKYHHGADCTSHTVDQPLAHDPCRRAEPRCEEQSISEQTNKECEDEHLGSSAYSDSLGLRDANADTYDVFLTYCEESSSDRNIARQLKEMLERSELRVYDAIQDLLPGHPEVHVVSAVANSAAHIVLLSPAYCSSPYTSRLHFPQILHAVFGDRVPLHHVLVVHTSGTFDTGRGEGGACEDRVVLPEWFRAFTNIHWSPVTGLCEEGQLRVWIRNVTSAQEHVHEN